MRVYVDDVRHGWTWRLCWEMRHDLLVVFYSINDCHNKHQLSPTSCGNQKLLLHLRPELAPVEMVVPDAAPQTPTSSPA